MVILKLLNCSADHNTQSITNILFFMTVIYEFILNLHKNKSPYITHHMCENILHFIKMHIHVFQLNSVSHLLFCAAF